METLNQVLSSLKQAGNILLNYSLSLLEIRGHGETAAVAVAAKLIYLRKWNIIDETPAAKLTWSSQNSNIFHKDDLVEEILLHLPPIDVVRFKCVSKRWYDIISNPTFLRRHTLSFHRYSLTSFLPSIILQDNSKPGDQVLFCLNRDNPSVFPDPTFSFIENAGSAESDFRILHSCNGLLLLDYGNIFVCNPMTKEYIKLPYCEMIDSEGLTSFGMNLVFDPSRSLHYKVVGVFEITDEEEGVTSWIAIYSSESHSWGASIDYGYRNISNFSKAIVMNGFLYWQPDADGECIHYFDVDLEQYYMRLLPSKCPESKYCSWHYLGRSKDHLYLVEEDFKYNSVYKIDYNIFEIKEDEIICHSTFSIGLEQRYAPQLDVFGWLSTLCIHTVGLEDRMFYGLDCFIHYVPLRGTDATPVRVDMFSHLVQSKGNEHINGRTWDALPYTNTLFPLQLQ